MTRKLLVVDDDKSITRIIGRIAGGLGYDVKSINDPSEALDAFVTYQPDVLMIDMVMPGLDGVDILREVAAQRSAVKVVAMSGFGAGYLRLAKAVAAFDAQPGITELAKPFRRADIVAVLEDRRPHRVDHVVFGPVGLDRGTVFWTTP
jgi:two-component system response regulator MtrA